MVGGFCWLFLVRNVALLFAMRFMNGIPEGVSVSQHTLFL